MQPRASSQAPASRSSGPGEPHQPVALGVLPLTVVCRADRERRVVQFGDQCGPRVFGIQIDVAESRAAIAICVQPRFSRRAREPARSSVCAYISPSTNCSVKSFDPRNVRASPRSAQTRTSRRRARARGRAKRQRRHHQPIASNARRERRLGGQGKSIERSSALEQRRNVVASR